MRKSFNYERLLFTISSLIVDNKICRLTDNTFNILYRKIPNNTSINQTLNQHKNHLKHDMKSLCSDDILDTIESLKTLADFSVGEKHFLDHSDLTKKTKENIVFHTQSLTDLHQIIESFYFNEYITSNDYNNINGKESLPSDVRKLISILAINSGKYESAFNLLNEILYCINNGDLWNVDLDNLGDYTVLEPIQLIETVDELIQNITLHYDVSHHLILFRNELSNVIKSKYDNNFIISFIDTILSDLLTKITTQNVIWFDGINTLTDNSNYYNTFNKIYNFCDVCELELPYILNKTILYIDTFNTNRHKLDKIEHLFVFMLNNISNSIDKKYITESITLTDNPVIG